MVNRETITLPIRDTRSVIILAHIFLLFGLVFLALGAIAFDLNAQTLIYPTCIALSSLYIWLLWSWNKATDSLFDPYVMFLTAAILFNSGQAILEVFHLNPDGILNDQFSPETILQTLFLVLLGMAAFHFGGLISVLTVRKSTSQIDAAPRQRAVRQIGWALLFISFLPAVLLLRDAIAVVLSGGYAALFQQEAPTSFGATPQILAAFLVPGSLFLLAGSKGERIGTMVSALIILLYAALEFFIGSRSWAAMPLLAYAWLWHHSIRPLPRFLLVTAGSIALFVLFPIIEVIRIIPGGERLDFSSLRDAFVSIPNPLVAILSEMGTSMLTVAHTLELVPTARTFDWGMEYLYAFLTIFPNFFWDVHPAIAYGLPSDWLVSTIAPYTAAQGGGFGFSFIAEAYLNFGWVGSPICLLLIGAFFGRFSRWAQVSGEPARVAAVASFFSFSLLYARGEAVMVIRPLFWYALLPFLLVSLLSRLNVHMAELRSRGPRWRGE